MSGYQVEDKLNKIASEVAGEYLASGKNGELEHKVASASKKYMLSGPEVETLNAKVNHAVFKEKFAHDKTDTFVISKYENILKLDRGMNIVEYRVGEVGHGEMGKAASEEDTSTGTGIDDITVTPQNAPLLMEAGEKNIDDMRDLRRDRSAEISAIKNRIAELVRDGESLSNIYALLRDTWGDDNKEDLKPFFNEMIGELKKDGYISDDTYSENVKSVDVDDSEPIKKSAERIAEIGSQIVLRELAHEMIVEKLACDYWKMAYDLERKMPGDYMGTSIALYKEANEVIKQAADGVSVTNALKNAAIWGGAFAGMTGAGALAKSAINTIRKNIWEEKLKQRYPELYAIDDDRYKDLYGSIVGLEPHLLRAPYALKEMIKAHDQYGTLDSNTTLKLLESGRKGNPNAPLVAKAISRGMELNTNMEM